MDTDTGRLIRAIRTDTLFGLRDIVLTRLMVYILAPVSAGVGMQVKEVLLRQHAPWVRLHEKGGKRHEMSCQHNLKDWLREYIKAAGIGEDGNGPLFRTVDRKTKTLGTSWLDRQRAWAMVKRRAREAGIDAPGICNHTFWGTGITADLENPEAKHEHAAHSPAIRPKTTRLYDRRRGSLPTVAATPWGVAHADSDARPPRSGWQVRCHAPVSNARCTSNLANA